MGRSARLSRRPTPEEAAEETPHCRLRRLLGIGELLLEIGDPLLRLMQAQILDQHGLRQVIGQIRLGGHCLTDQSIGLGILVLPRGIFHAVEQGRKKLFFLGGHECLPMLEKRCLPMKNISAATSARRIKCGKA